MKLWHNITLLGVAIREQVRAERAYLGNFWFGVISRMAYNVMFLLLIDQLFKKIGSVAGFSQNDFLFMYFMSQLGFYVTYYIMFAAMQRLIIMVQNGNLDLLLLKPVPHRAYIYVSGLQLYDLLIGCVPPTILVATMIDFSALAITPISLLLGILVSLSGITIASTMLMLLVLPAFRSGMATETLNIFYSVTAISQMPFSRLPMIMKFLSLVIFPQIIIAGAVAEVMLNKADIFAITGVVVAAAAVSLVMSRWLWGYALRNYTSASS